MDAREMASSENVVLNTVGADMEMDRDSGQNVTSVVKESVSNGIAVAENGDGHPPVKENAHQEGSRQSNDMDDEAMVFRINAKGDFGSAIEGEAVDSEGSGSLSAVENAVVSEHENGDNVRLSVVELVAKARAPLKSEFLTNAGVRILVPNGTVTGSTNGVWDERKESRVVPEKKSKRQLKRERLLAKKSPEGICAIVARTGDVKQCPYGANCRFNHDLEGYRAQKPPDLPGKCPSVDSGDHCSYGIACRFAGTHKEFDGHESFQERRSNIALNELNNLSKELQKLLWKNMGSYPKADAQLQAMGLMNKAFKLRKGDGEDNQMQEPGRVESEAAEKRSVDVRFDADEPTKQSSLEGVSTAPVDSKMVEDQGTVGSIGDVPKSLVATKDSVICPMEARSPPQKRLKSEADETVGESLTNDKLAKDHKGRGVARTPTKPDMDETKSNTVDVPAGDVEAETEIGKTIPETEGWRSLYVESKLGPREKRIIDFREKLYLAPLTTVGNLPFRRVCKGLGADITCGEMAMCTNLLQGQASEWALLRRHSCEDLFGVQICGSFPDHVARTAELIEQECTVDFIDINMGCPIDLVVNKGSGSCLLTKPQRLEQLCRVTAAVMEKPLTVKMRMGYYEGRNCAHTLMPNLNDWGVNAVTVHGRTRQQRYSKQADWAYVQQCVAAAQGDLQVIGNGDIFSYTDWTEHLKNAGSRLSTCMIARGALIKPWLFCEIKERKHWDISSGERLDILRQYVHCGLAHWGSDSKGVETTRHFLLEWLSYMHRYIPVGLLEVIPQRLNWRPPSYFGRNDLETLMASESAADWVRITELLLGPTSANFVFNPKHKSNAYDKPENG